MASTKKNSWHIYDILTHTACVVDNTPPVLHLRLIALFHDIGKVHTFTVDERGVGHFYGHNSVSAKRARELFNKIRGLSPFPLAYAMRGDNQLKLVSVKMTDKKSDKAAGSLISDGKKLYVVCGDGLCLEITEVLPAGKKRMSASDYLRGNLLKDGELLSTPV